MADGSVHGEKDSVLLYGQSVRCIGQSGILSWVYIHRPFSVYFRSRSIFTVIQIGKKRVLVKKSLFKHVE